VQQVILNLVRNALEAMAGCPRRELRIGSRSEGEFVEVHVADTGPGIAPELAESLFQPFVSGKPNGMGVGLAICRSIIESHGGKIWAAANPEGGAVFHFSLPRAGERAAA
jgi:two-component system sensor kinase FixL